MRRHRRRTGARHSGEPHPSGAGRIVVFGLLTLSTADLAIGAPRRISAVARDWWTAGAADGLSIILSLVALVWLIVMARRRTESDRRASDAAHYVARHDSLTGLPNHQAFRDEVATRLGQPYRYGEKVAIVTIAIEDIRIVNDRFGRACGDELLRMAANRLRADLRKEDFLARIGGEVFAVIQTDVLLREAANGFVATLAEPFATSAGTVRVATKLGVAAALEQETDADALIRRADLALGRARESRVTQIAFYTPSMSNAALHRAEFRAALADAVLEDQFAVQYQPILEVATNRIVGCEALVRWSHHQHGPIAPADFVPILEETGWIVTVGERLLRRAARDAAFWPDTVRVAVNISPLQCCLPGFIDAVRGALLETGLAPERLELEITRSIAVPEQESASAILDQLRALGVRIAFDNFGTGRAPMSDLVRFPFDRIKIDRSLIARMGEGSRANILVQAAIDMAERLGMGFTAEGVETEQQSRLLRMMGCPEMQGYLLSRPLEPIMLSRFMAAHGLEHRPQRGPPSR